MTIPRFNQYRFQSPQMRISFWMALLSGVGIIFLVFFQWMILGIIGPGKETDAFFAAMMVPEVFQAVVTGSLTHVLVPLFATAEKEQLDQDASTFFWGFGLLFFALFLLLSVTSSHWLPVAFPGFDEQSLQLTASLIKIQLFGMVLTAMSAVLASVGNAKKRFIHVEVSAVAGAGTALLLLIYGLSRYGIIIAAWAICLRGLVQLILLVPQVGAFKKPDWKSIRFREGLSRLYPLLWGTSFYKTEVMLDRFFASMAPAGQLSIFQFARQLFSSGNTVLGKAIVTPMVPLLAEKAQNYDWHGFQRLTQRRLLVSIIVCGFFFIPLMAVGKPVLHVILGHGKFNVGDVSLFFGFLILLGGLWFGGAAGQVLSTGFYAKGDTRTPTRIGIFAYVVGIFVKAAGFALGGIKGLAIGTTIYFLLAAACLHLGLHRSLDRLLE